MNPRHSFLWAFFVLEITLCGLSNSSFVGAADNPVKLIRVHRDHQEPSSSTSNSPVLDKSKPEDTQATNKSTTRVSGPVENWLKEAETAKNSKSEDGNKAVSPTVPENKTLPLNSTGAMIIRDKGGPDPHYPNITTNAHSEYDDRGSEGHSTTNYSGQPKFDEKAVQRALMVCGGLAAVMVIYFALKFAFLRKRKIGKRYGRIESEMDLLDEIEDLDSGDEDDTLFDLNSTRRSQF